MKEMHSIITRLTILGLLLISLNAGLLAQSPAGRRGKASKQTCDGALDIVPVKAVTFARKRRPAPAATKGAPAATGVVEKKSNQR